MQSINREIAARAPGALCIAEDMQDNEWLTRDTDGGGAGFGAQWGAGFHHTIRSAIVSPDDDRRDMVAVRSVLEQRFNDDSFQRVLYTESHDEVANGLTRVPEAISPGSADDWWAKKRAVLGSALVLTSPGIPMLFQGQELLEDRWFDDAVALDWEKASTNRGILRLHHDLIDLRRARDGVTRGLRGSNLTIIRADQQAKLLAMHRWMDGGPHDDTLVLANFADRTLDDVRIGFPAPGRWNVRFNSDASGYAPDFGGHDASDLDADGPPMDGCRQSGLVSVGPYSVVILSRED
jgi:1,4-alpha-glucan branching enzyme